MARTHPVVKHLSTGICQLGGPRRTRSKYRAAHVAGSQCIDTASGYVGYVVVQNFQAKWSAMCMYIDMTAVFATGTSMGQFMRNYQQ